jgi:hypothetical protein
MQGTTRHWSCAAALVACHTQEQRSHGHAHSPHTHPCVVELLPQRYQLRPLVRQRPVCCCLRLSSSRVRALRLAQVQLHEAQVALQA